MSECARRPCQLSAGHCVGVSVCTNLSQQNSGVPRQCKNTQQRQQQIKDASEMSVMAEKFRAAPCCTPTAIPHECGERACCVIVLKPERVFDGHILDS
jgi:hypothetical protein